MANVLESSWIFLGQGALVWERSFSPHPEALCHKTASYLQPNYCLPYRLPSPAPTTSCFLLMRTFYMAEKQEHKNEETREKEEQVNDKCEEEKELER